MAMSRASLYQTTKNKPKANAPGGKKLVKGPKVTPSNAPGGKKLTPKQKAIANKATPKNKITGADFKAIKRQGKRVKPDGGPISMSPKLKKVVSYVRKKVNSK
tara:strand:+ start:856 stop:1164 length:309 start_codon:yes stop_codon:yes gene_type:complete